jgi:hypothetical protein
MQSMKAVAIKQGQTRERAPDFKEMGTLQCVMVAVRSTSSFMIQPV